MGPVFQEPLPYWLNRRLEGLSSYVSALLREEFRDSKVDPVVVEAIQIAAFLKSLEEFLSDGTQAAVGAVDALEKVGVAGFQVGKELFSQRNEAVLRGSELAQALRSQVQDPVLREAIDSTSSVRELVFLLARLLKNEKTVG